MRTKYTEELLAPIVKKATSFDAVLRALALRRGGGNQSHIKRLINMYALDTSHFLGQTYGLNRGCYPKRHWTQILRKQKQDRRQPSDRLRRALLESGRKHVCARCEQPVEWRGKPLTLQIDHKNGDWRDDRPTNLQFLCPNCHTQKTTDDAAKKCAAR
jgi:hypothetical protein